MGQEHDSSHSDIHTSRRHVLASFGEAVAISFCGRSQEGQHELISSFTMSNRQSMDQRTAPSQDQGRQRPAFVALPGLSTASLLANLPYLMTGWTGLRPTILMDIYDYNRLQAIALKETNAPWNKNLAMAYGHLFRRGVVRLIDYAEFYRDFVQRETIQQNRAVLEEASYNDLKGAAEEAAAGRIAYQRGEYQETFRVNLGENLDTFIGGRRTEENRRQKLKRGCGDPFEWNEKIFDQYTAALEIRRCADDVFDHLDVKHVIGEGESPIFTGDDLGPNAPHLTEEEMSPETNIQELSPHALANTREVFETIGEIATKTTRVQHDDWVLLGPTLAVPQYDDDLFNLPLIETQVQYGRDPMELAEEADEVIALLERRTKDDFNSNADYAAQWLAESDMMPFAPNKAQIRAIREVNEYAETLARYSNELRPLVKSDSVSPAAALVAASIVSDPPPHDDLKAIYRRGEDLINRLNPPSTNEAQLTAIRRRMQGWEDIPDWYEMTTDRVR